MEQIILTPVIKDWTIVFEFQNTNAKTMVRYQQYFQQLIEANVFETRNGKVIMNFDNDGKLREVGYEFKKRLS